jgi:hypothetical protein
VAFEEFLNRKVVVFFDDGSAQNNVKRKCGIVSELSDNMVMIVEDVTLTKMIFPRERIIRMELESK